MRLIPIVPTSGLYLTAWGHCDDARFAEQFRLAWKQIPMRCRKAIVAHWLLWGKVTGNRKGAAPFLEVLPYKSDWERGPSRYAVAQCSQGGNSLSWNSGFVDALPDEHLRCFIAHELAHVFLFATDPTHFADGDYEVAELQVFQTLEAWGFDESAREEWEMWNEEKLPTRATED